MRVSFALLLLGGCSQVFGLESPATSADAHAPGDSRSVDTTNCGAHDFDGDGIFDDCDMCPHLPSSNQDADGDLVGDQCDPLPENAGEKRVLWLAFYDLGEIAGWVNTNGNGAWDISGGTLHETNAGFSQLDSPMPFTTDIYFATSLVITQPNTDEVGFCAADMSPGLQYYCCAVSNMTTPTVRAVSAFSGSGGQLSSSITNGNSLDAGQRIDFSGYVQGDTFGCRFVQSLGPPILRTTIAGGRAGPVMFYTTTPVDYRYLFVVTHGS